MASPIPAVSKNQRASGPKQAQKGIHCANGHAMTWVNIASRGRKNMTPMCACSGYTPIGKQ